MKGILSPKIESLEAFERGAGGKGLNLYRLQQLGALVPDFFCVSNEILGQYIEKNSLVSQLALLAEEPEKAAAERIEKVFLSHPLSAELKVALEQSLVTFDGAPFAVRSSGLEEDSADHSFAGQFSTFLFQRSMADLELSIRRCWASAYSERALAYRLEKGLPIAGLQMGVVVQRMIDPEVSGVAFSKNPIRPLDQDIVIISSVWGVGEGLVSGELDADSFEFHRQSKEHKAQIVKKTHGLFRATHGGLEKREIPQGQQDQASLTDAQVAQVAELALRLEAQFKKAQDLEWGIFKGELYCLQTRPITNFPATAFFLPTVLGDQNRLWDNSNIIESYSGVTSPLTFSFASYAYRQVYIQFCQVMGVPESMIASHEDMYRNMLGYIRGRVFYNLINWYKLVLMLPGSSSNKGFMEVMMGVKQNLKPEVAKVFEFADHPPQYGFWAKFSLTYKTIHRFVRIDSVIQKFRADFEVTYQKSRQTKFNELSLDELLKHYQGLEENVLKRWQAPIINDYLCMVFFGLLKKLTEKWIASGASGTSLQNDLLCGEGDLESTEPTKMLMRIAESVDRGPVRLREKFLTTPAGLMWADFAKSSADPEWQALGKKFQDFLERYGFRCINELKLEENDLHDDPSFILHSVQSYVKGQSYSIQKMEERERAIRHSAEIKAKESLGPFRQKLYFWVLRQARKAVKNRENLRFARTKIFGIARHIFRAIGQRFVDLEHLQQPKDIFFLSVEELFAFAEGRSLTMRLREIVELRKREHKEFMKTPPPPDRLLTTGPVGIVMGYLPVLLQNDLMASEEPTSDDPNILIGTPCCPGVVEGVVRVVTTTDEAMGLHQEILVTERTDPGWVPLYPSCTGLLIERGSLLSHSAVVARELGLPTIVGISGGLMKKLKTGMRVRVDAGRGEVRILNG